MPSAAELKRQIAELDQLIRDGVLTGEPARQTRARLEEELTAMIVGKAATGKGSAPASARATDAVMSATGLRPASSLVGGIAAFVLVVGVAGYAWLGNWPGLSVAPNSGPVAVADGSRGSHDLGAAQIEGMIERLAERLKAAPNDADGWVMLGRSYSALGRHADALPAYRRVVELRPKDAAAYADLADAVGTANGRSLEGEPEQLIVKALALDANNVKALSLAGTVLFKRGDPAGAARNWEKALQQAERGSELERQLQGALDDARQRAGQAGAPAAVAGAAPTGAQQAAAPPAASAQAAIRGRVTLAASLKGQVSPDDTVFVFARALQSGKAPLAILRRQVKDLPLDFTLDDSLAMSPAMRLSTVDQVHVGARISKSGGAMPQAGDLQGLVGPVKVGSNGVSVEIAEALR